MKKTPRLQTGSITQGRKARLPLNSVLASSLVVASIPLLSHSVKAQTTTTGSIAWSTTPTTPNFGDVNWTAGTTGGAPAFAASSGNALFFDTSNITTLNNNLTAGSTFAGLTFNSDASAYTIGGNAFTLTGGITNSSANVEAINAGIALSSADQTVTAASGGTVQLGGALTSNHNLAINGAGTVVLSGSNPTYQGALFVGYSNTSTAVGNGTLQLQFNSANTTSGVSNVYTAGTTGNQIIFANNSTLQLRGDTSATVSANNLGGFNGETITFNVASLSGTTTGQTLSLNSNNSNFANAVTINATGANGYILGLVKVNDVNGGTGNNLTLNPTSAGISFGGFQTSVASGTAATATLTLGGTDTSGNSNVTGLITNTVAGNASASVVIVKNNTSTWTISGSTNNYSGGTTVSAGTLILAATTAGTSTASATGTGGITVTGGTLQLANSLAQTTGASTLTLGGGTLNTNNKSQTFGALTLTASTTSTLDFGATATTAATVTFTAATFGSGATLKIADYNASLDTFNIGTTLTAAQLAQINDPGFTASQSGTTITFAPVPEPSTWMGGVFGLVALGWSLLRRRQAV